MKKYWLTNAKPGSRIRNAKPVYIILSLLLIIFVSYFGFRQYTVKSCYSNARSDFKDAKEKFEQEKGYKPNLTRSEEAFRIENRYITCMRDKGFSE